MDAIYRIPVPNVELLNSNNTFVGLSNKIGRIYHEEANFPLTARCFGYELFKLDKPQDTVFLIPDYQDLEEVDVKPVNKMELYNEILSYSSDHVDRSTSVVSGVYFESAMVVYKSDTVYLDNVCEMGIEKVFQKKKYAYNLHCQNGRRSYRNETKDMEDFDTTLLNTCLGLIKKFKDNLKYDLISTKPYKLKFEEEEIIRNTDNELHRLIFEKDEKDKTTVITNYKGRQLYTWNSAFLSSKRYDGDGLFVNYKRFNRYHEFSTAPYFLKTIIANGLVQIAVDGKFIEIYVVKGFMQNDGLSIAPDRPVKNVEDYFETIPYGKESASFYTFERK